MVEITLQRSAKIWWSFVWRAWVLTLPMALIMYPIMLWIVPFSKPGDRPGAINPGDVSGLGGKIFIMWLVMVVGMVVTQSFAVKWMLKTRWSDFKLVLVANESPPSQ